MDEIKSFSGSFKKASCFEIGISVEELIDILRMFPKDAEVCICKDTDSYQDSVSITDIYGVNTRDGKSEVEIVI